MNHLIKVGEWNKLPHFELIGDPQCFYLWADTDGVGSHSCWITGRKAFRIYHELSGIKSKKELAVRLSDLHKKNSIGSYLKGN